jgi:hypothetical protein
MKFSELMRLLEKNGLPAGEGERLDTLLLQAGPRQADSR